MKYISNRQEASRVESGRGARHDFAKSHPRQWVDVSSSAYQRSVDHFVNPTHGSGWIVQAEPTGASPDPLSDPTQAAGASSKHSRPVASEHSPPTLCDPPQAQMFVPRRFIGKTRTIPPTAVGGIRRNPFAFVVGWA